MGCSANGLRGALDSAPAKRLARTCAQALVLLGLVGCAAAGKNVVRGETAAEPGLYPTERLLVMEGAASAPMRVVLNDNAAGEVFLRTPSRLAQVGDPELDHLLARMRATVEQERGVGIAAPQVGISRRVMLVKRLDQVPEQPFVAYVNPEVTQRSTETELDWEGCLSIPAGFGQVRRPSAIEVSYDLPAGGRGRERIAGFTARIFQHEMDHLDGILFIDRKEPGELMPEEAYREMRAREKEQASSAPAPGES